MIGGSLTYCPTCYPGVGIDGPQAHRGDISRRFPYGGSVLVYEDGVRLDNVERLIAPCEGPTLLFEFVPDPQHGPPHRALMRCPRCRMDYLRRLRFSDRIRVTYGDRVPDECRAEWLQ